MTTVENTPPPAPPAPPPVPASVAAIEAGAFYEKFESADLKNFASGFKSAEEVAALAHKFAPLKDADPAKLTTLPEKIEKIEDLAPLLERYAPADAAEYGFDKIEGADADFAAAMGELLKAHHVPAALGAKLAEGWQAYVTANAEAQAKAIEQEAAKEVTGFKKEYGAEGHELARRGLRYLKAEGVIEQDVAEVETMLGAGALMKISRLVGSRLREGEFVDGGNSKPPMTALEKLYPKEVARDRERRG